MCWDYCFFLRCLWTKLHGLGCSFRCCLSKKSSNTPTRQSIRTHTWLPLVVRTILAAKAWLGMSFLPFLVILFCIQLIHQKYFKGCRKPVEKIVRYPSIVDLIWCSWCRIPICQNADLIQLSEVFLSEHACHHCRRRRTLGVFEGAIVSYWSDAIWSKFGADFRYVSPYGKYISCFAGCWWNTRKLSRNKVVGWMVCSVLQVLMKYNANIDARREARFTGRETF